MLAHRTYTTESVKRLFASLETGKAGDLKPMGVLADYVEVDAQFEKPAEEFLHEELEYVVEAGALRVGVYLRVSTREQRERQSILTQRAEVERVCRFNGEEVVDWYADDGVSGTLPFEVRPEGARLLRSALASAVSPGLCGQSWPLRSPPGSGCPPFGRTDL